MNREDVIRMAREAGFPMAWMSDSGVLTWTDLEKFAALVAALVAAAEREACARVCEDINAKYAWPADIAERVASQWCADAIRARGEVK